MPWLPRKAAPKTPISLRLTIQEGPVALLSFTIDDYDNTDDFYSANDTLTIAFDGPTDRGGGAREGGKDFVAGLFNFSHVLAAWPKYTVFGRAELAKPASSLGYLWLWAALRSLEEPPSYSACPQRPRCRRQAASKSLILLLLTIRRGCAREPAGRDRRDAADAAAAQRGAPPRPERTNSSMPAHRAMPSAQCPVLRSIAHCPCPLGPN